VQALTLLNSSLVLDWARSFASRVAQMAGTSPREQIVVAYRLAYSRPPAPDEVKLALDFFRRHGEILAERAATGGKLAVPESLPEGVAPIEAATLVDFCHMLINSNEFVYRN